MKVILVLDEMPRSCFDCNLSKEAFDEDLAELIECGIEQSEITYGNDRPSWCPLKPLPPKRLDVLDDDTWQAGWNACLKEIIGDE